MHGTAMKYVDAHARIGPRPAKHPLERWTLAHLLADMELAGLCAALVTHEQACCYEPMHANLRLCKEIDPHRQRLFPCWVVMPHHAGDFPEPGRLLDLMSEYDIRAVEIAPNMCGCPPCVDIWKDLASALAGRSILVKIGMGSVDGFDEASSMIGIFSGSAVLLTDVPWSQWRQLNYLMKRHGNLHIEFSAFQANRAIETFGREYGFERLVFGSGQPRKSPGAARAFVDLAMINEAEKKKVAAGNLVRLLGLDKIPEPLSDPEWRDSLTLALMQGNPCPAHVVDAHAHVLHDGADSAGGHYVMKQGDARGQIELYDKMGVDAVAWMSWTGPCNCDAVVGNDIVAAAMAQFPERVIGLATIDPSHQNDEERSAEMRKCHEKLGFRGLKPYPRCGIPYDAPEFDSWWALANQYRLYGLLHLSDSDGDMAALEKLARKHSEVSFLAAHTGGSFSFARRVVDVMKQHENVFAELTLTPVTNGIVEWLCAEVGAERVLFGTDAPMRDPRPQLGWVILTRLTEDRKRLILGENFLRILARGSLPGHAITISFLPKRVIADKNAYSGNGICSEQEI